MLTQQALKALGERVRSTIRARTKKGLGVDGRRLKAREDGSTSTLTESGRLLDSIDVSVRGRDVVVEATAPYAEYVNQERPFMGLSEQEQRAEATVLEAEIEATLRERLLRVMG